MCFIRVECIHFENRTAQSKTNNFFCLRSEIYDHNTPPYVDRQVIVKPLIASLGWLAATRRKNSSEAGGNLLSWLLSNITFTRSAVGEWSSSQELISSQILRKPWRAFRSVIDNSEKLGGCLTFKKGCRSNFDFIYSLKSCLNSRTPNRQLTGGMAVLVVQVLGEAHEAAVPRFAEHVTRLGEIYFFWMRMTVAFPLWKVEGSSWERSEQRTTRPHCSLDRKTRDQRGHLKGSGASISESKEMNSSRTAVFFTARNQTRGFEATDVFWGEKSLFFNPQAAQFKKQRTKI